MSVAFIIVLSVLESIQSLIYYVEKSLSSIQVIIYAIFSGSAVTVELDMQVLSFSTIDVSSMVSNTVAVFTFVHGCFLVA